MLIVSTFSILRQMQLFDISGLNFFIGVSGFLYFSNAETEIIILTHKPKYAIMQPGWSKNSHILKNTYFGINNLLN